jgi:hypothetical protein
MAALNAALCYLAEHHARLFAKACKVGERAGVGEVAACEPQAGERLYRWPAPW